ncbi:hypothetical protein [Inquilinus sp.]|jgi:hypothetical protein|uniref:hypothetical protein n=1 Tax=Inquilinus sp. TaxID=1932117 RepID=UPI003783FEC1
MRLLPAIAAAAVLAVAGSAQAQAPHPCAADAVDHARKLLAFHFGETDMTETVDDTAKPVGTIKALQGNGRFDVLEVMGYIYKGEYRMHFIYAQIPGDCVLMGQEILETSDPY